MTTTVTLTGTGTPLSGSRRAGPGVLVRHGDVALQFDAGRATILHPSGPLPVVAATGEAADFVTRMAHLDAVPPEVALSTFTPPKEPAVVWHSADRAVTVRAVAVHHEPVKDAVAYRIDTPDAAVVIVGDAQVCAEIEELAREADLLIHETCRATALDGATREQDESFEEDLRSGGYTGRITAGRDFLDVSFPVGGDGACT